MMAGDRAHWPKGTEAMRAISDLANAMQAVAGWLQTMTDDELAAWLDRLDRMRRIVLKERDRRGHP